MLAPLAVSFSQKSNLLKICINWLNPSIFCSAFSQNPFTHWADPKLSSLVLNSISKVCSVLNLKACQNVNIMQKLNQISKIPFEQISITNMWIKQKHKFKPGIIFEMLLSIFTPIMPHFDMKTLNERKLVILKIYIKSFKSISQSLNSPLFTCSVSPQFVRAVRRRDRRMTDQASSQTFTPSQRLSAGGCVVVDRQWLMGNRPVPYTVMRVQKASVCCESGLRLDRLHIMRKSRLLD